MQFLRKGEAARLEELRQESVHTSLQTLQQWINLANQPLQRFVRDFSEWPELATFLERRDAAWAEANLHQNLATYEAHALWVLSAKGELIYSTQYNPGPPLPPPATMAELTSLADQSAHRLLFVESRDGLLQVWGEPIGLDDTGKNPRGWLMVARWWSPRFVATLGRLAEMQVQLVPAGAPPGDAAHLLLPLPDVQGATLRQLQTTLRRPDFAESLAADTLAVRVLLLFGLLVIAGVSLGVQQWVLRPLRQIGHSLAHDDPTYLSRLQQEENELGRIARLVTTKAWSLALWKELQTAADRNVYRSRLNF